MQSSIETDSTLKPKYEISQLRMVFRQFYGPNHPVNGGYFSGDNCQSYLKFNFGRIVKMKRIKIEGAGRSGDSWIKYFYIYMSNNSDSLDTVRTMDGSRHKFRGNFNKITVTQNSFNPPIIAQYLKFLSESCEKAFSVRLEIYGCNITKTYIDRTKPLGLTNFYILHSQMINRELDNLEYGIHEIRLSCESDFQNRGYYFAKSMWQFDLGIKHNIVKIFLRGSCVSENHMKSFQVKYTDDPLKWFDDKAANGQIRKYFAQDKNILSEVQFYETITARYIRFTPFSAAADIRMELYGYPWEHPKLMKTKKFPKTTTASSEKSSINSPEMALNTKQTFWCKEDNDLNGWWSADLGLIYYIERIIIFYRENLSRDVCSDISVFGSQNNGTNLIKVDQEIACSFEDNQTAIYSSPALRFRYIRLDFKNGPKECIRFELYGKKAPICPPGSLRHLDKCYMISEMVTSFEKALKFCQSGFYWKSEGFLVMPKNTFETDFVKRHYKLQKLNHGIYIGVKQISLNNFVWLDGTPVTNYLLFESNFSPHISYPCLIRRDFFKKSKCQENGYAMCETKANLPDNLDDFNDEEKCQPTWFLMPHHRLDIQLSIGVLDVTSMGNCLAYCLSHKT
ncbi:DgyrCDS14491, partial [Dimorphilus gyrociliatus]